MDRDVNGDVDEVSQCQAGDQGVGAISHVLVEAYDPQKRSITHYTNHKDHTR